jgi:hypothetical protein
MLTGTLILNKFMKTFQENDIQRKKFIRVYLSITVITTLQALFFFSYAPFMDNASNFGRYMFENISYLFYDIPIILIITHYHYKTFSVIQSDTPVD